VEHTLKPIKISVLFSWSFFITLSSISNSTFAQNSHIPQWAKKVVWYQIFPERFRNGDPHNDPALHDILGSWPFDDTSSIQTIPWTSDWYELQPWEQNGKGFYYHAQRRRYGGDLQGVLDKLDYLQDLGINAIYFNPLFESPSLHKYDGSMYHHIENNFGPDPEGDRKIFAQEISESPASWQWTSADKLFLKLIDECHQRNIYVIIDGVFNHVGINFFAFADLKRNQQQSKYKNWFTVIKWDDPVTPTDEFEYECWANVKGMPEIREDENGFDKDAWAYMQAAIRRWMDPNGDGNPQDGIDGWRLDVAEMVTKVSWLQFREFTRSINPQSYLTAEVWWEDWPFTMFNAAPWLQGDMFDAVMNYRFADAVVKFFINKNKKISVTQFDSLLKQIRTDYPAEVNYVLQNLIDSHDTDRLPSMIVNPDRVYGHANHVRGNNDYRVRKPHPDEIQIQKLILLFQITYLGSPMISYGDEAGMWGANDPDERKPMLWQDLTYDDEVSHPFGKARPADKNEFNADLFEYYKKLIHIRIDNPALMLGDYQPILLSDASDIYIFKRKYENQVAVIALNNSAKSRRIEIPLTGNRWMDCVTSTNYESNRGVVSVALQPKTGVILIPSN